MTISMNRRLFMGTMAATGLVSPAFAATNHTVEMLNADPDNPRQRFVFSPRLLVVEPGDTVTFLPTDPGHNSEIVDGMIPAGTEGWKGRINKEVAATLDQPGFYGYVCTPHASVGMVGLVVVQGEGMMDNLEDAKGVRQRGAAKKAWDEIWAEVDELGLTA